MGCRASLGSIFEVILLPWTISHVFDPLFSHSNALRPMSFSLVRVLSLARRRMGPCFTFHGAQGKLQLALKDSQVLSNEVDTEG